MRPGDRPVSEPDRKDSFTDLQTRWADLYGPHIASQLEPDCKYVVIKIGEAEFAYSDYGAYLRALGQAWDAGFVPEALPDILGSELPKMAPSIRGLNADLSGLEPDDEAPPRGRFRPSG